VDRDFFGIVKPVGFPPPLNSPFIGVFIGGAITVKTPVLQRTLSIMQVLRR
jgi:hypothetical protein